MTAQLQIQSVLDEAATWIGTPWHHNARVKGAGVDCAHFLCAVYEAAGLVLPIDLGYYPQEWHLHQDRSRFLEVLSEYADQVDAPLPGDVAMFRYGRHPAHGSIVVDWPTVVHAHRGEAVVYADASKEPLVKRLAGWWRLKALRSE